MTNLRAGIPLSYVICVSVRRDLTLPVLEVTTFSQSTDHFLLQMSMKTAKGWIDIGKADLADGFLEIAMNSIEKLYAKLRKEGDGEADIHVCKADVEKDLFKVLSYQAESAVAQGDFQKAMQCVQRCKDMLVRLPREVSEIIPSLSCQSLKVCFPPHVLKTDICYIQF